MPQTPGIFAPTRAIGVIPARYGSTRFDGKPLKMILHKPLLQWVIEGAKSTKKLTEILVATDHEDIFALAQQCGVRAIMTPSTLPTGSDRVYAAVRDMECDVVVNIQGDEPLLTGELLDQLVMPLMEDATLEMATLGRSLHEGDLLNPNTAKIVLNRRSEALYFSRLPIPHSRIDAGGQEPVCLKHIGLYAFRKSFLAAFCALQPTPLELAEGLEQLRALYMGARIHVVKVDHNSWGVDVPGDVAKVEALLRQERK